MNTWAHTIAHRLKQRDLIETSFTTIIDSHTRLQRRNEQLEKRLVLISQSDGNAGQDTALKQQNNELKEQLSKLQTDLLQKYKTEAQNSSSALTANQQAQATQNQLKIIQLELAQRSQAFQLSEERTKELEINMKEQEARLILYQDELKRLRQTRENSDKKVNELTRDNQMLLQRMLDDKQRLGEELNRMNTLYERLRTQAGGGSNSSSNTNTTNSGSGNSNSNGNTNSASKERTRNGNDGTGGGNGGVRSTLPKEAKMWTKAHETKVNGIVCSPDGSSFATCSDDGTVKLFQTTTLTNGASGQLIQSRSNKSPVVCIDWISNYIIGGSTDRIATLWDVRTEREHVRLSGHKGKILCCKFVNQTAKHVVTGSADASIRLWDTRQGFTTRTIGCSSVCNAIDVSADGYTCISGHLDGVVRTWDLRNGKNVHEIRGIHEMAVTSVKFSPSSASASLLLTLSRENKLRIFDGMTWESKNCIGGVDDDNASNFTVGATTTKAVFSSDALYCTAGSANGTVMIWDVTSGKILSKLNKHQSIVTGIAWRQDGRLVFSVDQRGYVVVWA